MKIVPREIKVLSGVRDISGRISRVGVCVHSTSDNTDVKVWVFCDCETRKTRAIVLGGEESGFEMLQIGSDGLVVFGVALSCDYLPGSEDSLLIQATGVASREQLGRSRSQEIDMFEISPPDSSDTPTHKAVFKLLVSIEKEASDSSSSSSSSPVELTSYDYAEVSHGFTGMRFPGTSANPDFPFFQFETREQRVCTSTSWVGGKPYPAWITAPKNIRHQRADLETLFALVDLTEKWAAGSSGVITDKELRWAQMACQFAANAVPYSSDYCLTAPYSDKEVRDVTFSPLVFGFGDCEDSSHLACSVWMLLRDTTELGSRNPRWGSVQRRMKNEFLEPMVLFCLAPSKDSLVSHASAVVLRKGSSSQPVSIDGVTPHNSFFTTEGARANEKFLEETRVIHAAHAQCDVRRLRDTNIGSSWSEKCSVAYLVDPDGNYYFPKTGKGKLTFKCLNIDALRKVVPGEKWSEDGLARKLMPLPELSMGPMKARLISGDPQTAGSEIGMVLCVGGNREVFVNEMKSKTAFHTSIETISLPRGREVIVAHFYKEK